MNKIYYRKNMAHENKEYFITFTALPESQSFYNVIKDKRERKMMCRLLQSGKLSKWFKARVTVTLLGSDVRGVVEIPECSMDRFDDFISNKQTFTRLVKLATNKLEQELSHVSDENQTAA